jgi:cation:H+ antiporter
MLILAVVSLVPGSRVFGRVALDHTLTAALVIILTTMAAIVILIRPDASFVGVGVGSVAILVVYLIGTRALYLHSASVRRAGETAEMAASTDDGRREHANHGSASLRRPLVAFGAASALILVVAPIFAASAQAVARATGLAESFVGTWLVGFSTSLPELVTSLAAIRIGAYDLAVGNLFGSNAVNMVMFLPLDLAHGPGPILGIVHPVHAVSALVAVVLMAIGLAAIVYHAKGKLSMLEPSSGLILLGYVVGLAIVYAMSAAP